jgi:hypothetical protein
VLRHEEVRLAKDLSALLSPAPRWWRTEGRAEVLVAEIPAEIERLDEQVGKVLATEGDDLALGHEARQLVLARRTKTAEATELDAADFGADGRR